jgi:hypothetical protein
MVGHLIGGIISLPQKAPENRGRAIPVELFSRQSLELADIPPHVSLLGDDFGKALFHAVAYALATLGGLGKTLLHTAG